MPTERQIRSKVPANGVRQLWFECSKGMALRRTLRAAIIRGYELSSAIVRLTWFPNPLRWLIFGALGVCLGLAGLTVHVSRAPSYLSDEPEVCVNCHVMRPEYVSWRHSSHAEVAHCNDCHVPHDSFLAHWLFKARDGLWHATVFTMRWEPQVIRLSERAVPVVEANCRRCHEHLVSFTSLREHEPGDLRCWDCHGDVPHGETRGLASSPGYLDPSLPPLGSGTDGVQIGGRAPR